MKRAIAAASVVLMPLLAAPALAASPPDVGPGLEARAAFVAARGDAVAALPAPPAAPAPSARSSAGTFNQDGLSDYCGSQSLNDGSDGLAVDVTTYSLSYDCIDETWTFEMLTIGSFTLEQIELLGVAFDTDLNGLTGDVDGTDYSVLALPTGGGIAAVVIRTPTPDDATWSLNGSAQFAQLNPGWARMTWKYVALGAPAVFDWYGIFSTTRDATAVDEFPNVDFNRMVTPVDPPATPPVLGPSRFVPVVPFRLIDTRAGVGTLPYRLYANSTYKRRVAGVATTSGTIPGNVLAVALNVTVVGPSGNGYATVYPSGPDLPPTSNLNFTAGQVVPSFVVTPVGEQGKISITTTHATHLVADVQGYFVPAASSTDGRYVALNPERVLDTRIGAPAVKPGAGSVVNVVVRDRAGVPASGVSAVVLNVTATQTSGPGFVSVYPGPAGAPPPIASNLNIERAWQTIPNLVTVPLGPDGSVNLYTFAGTHLIADVAGYFTDATAASSAAGLFVPKVPSRQVDTRIGLGIAGTAGPLAPGATFEVVVENDAVPVGTTALLVNATAVGAPSAGFITLYPSAPRPEVSNLNIERPYQVIPNAAIVTLNAARGFSVHLQSGGSIILDVSGYFQP